eukprot:tig00001477_g8896.t1
MAQLDARRVIQVDTLSRLPWTFQGELGGGGQEEWGRAAAAWSPNLALWPRTAAEADTAYARLKDARPAPGPRPSYPVPGRLHYRDSERVPPLLALADPARPAPRPGPPRPLAAETCPRRSMPGWSIATSRFLKQYPRPAPALAIHPRPPG